MTRLNISCSVLQLLTVWLQETYWAYSAKMTSVVDREVYIECVSTAIKKYFCDHPLVSICSYKIHETVAIHYMHML